MSTSRSALFHTSLANATTFGNSNHHSTTVISKDSSCTSSISYKGAWLALCIVGIEIAYKLLLIPMVFSEPFLVAALLLLCLFPACAAIGLTCGTPFLCLPYLVYNFAWTLIYGLFSAFFLYQLIVMDPGYVNFMHGYISQHYRELSKQSVFHLPWNVVYFATLGVLFLCIFGALISLNIENVIHQAFYHKRASNRAAKHIRAIQALAQRRSQEKGSSPSYTSYRGQSGTLSTIYAPTEVCGSGGSGSPIISFNAYPYQSPRLNILSTDGGFQGVNHMNQYWSQPGMTSPTNNIAGAYLHSSRSGSDGGSSSNHSHGGRVEQQSPTESMV